MHAELPLTSYRTNWMRCWARRRIDDLLAHPVSGLALIGGVCPWVVYPRLLNRDSVVYSGGVGRDISFEKELVRRFELRINLFDPSPTGRATMAREPAITGIDYYPIGLAGKSGVRGFLLPVDPAEGSYSLGGKNAGVQFECVSVSSWMRRKGHERVDLLKLDVEGFEYEVLDDVLSSGAVVTQICVEFHHQNQRWGKLKGIATAATLKRAGYKLVYKSRGDHTFILSAAVNKLLAAQCLEL